MTIEEAIQITLLSNDHIMNIGEIEAYIRNKNLLPATNQLDSKIKNYFSQPHANMIEFKGRYLYIPDNNPLDEMLRALKTTDPNSNGIKEINIIDPSKICLVFIEKLTTDRAKFACYSYISSKFISIGIGPLSTYNPLIESKSKKIVALGLFWMQKQNPSSFFQLEGSDFNFKAFSNILEEPDFSESAFKILNPILKIACPLYIIDKAADLLLNSNNSISYNAYKFIFASHQLFSYPIMFSILSNWQKYKQNLKTVYAIEIDDIFNMIEDASKSNFFKNTTFKTKMYKSLDNIMLVYCNSHDLKIKEHAIKFMHSRWNSIDSFDHIDMSPGFLNAKIKINLLKSFFNKESKKATYYAKKWIYDSDSLVEARSLFVLRYMGGEEERELLRKISVDYMRKNHDVAPEGFLPAIEEISKRLGED